MAVSTRLIDCARRLLQPSMATSLSNLLGQHIGCSDAAWNMLSISPQMHDWWARGLFAFFCRGITPDRSSSTVHLQFRWMPRKPVRKTAPKPERLIGDDDDDLHDMINWHSTSSNAYDQSVMAVKAGLFRPVLSGDNIDVERTNEEAEKMKIMIDFQWALISILSLSGAAGAPELLHRPDDFDNPGAQRIYSWLESVATPISSPMPETRERPLGSSRSQQLKTAASPNRGSGRTQSPPKPIGDLPIRLRYASESTTGKSLPSRSARSGSRSPTKHDSENWAP